MDRHHSQLGFWFRLLLLSLTQCLCPTEETHVSQTDFQHVYPPLLNAHLGHVFPDDTVVDESYGLLGLVQVAAGEVLAEVQQGVLQVVVYVCIDDFVVPHDVVGLAQGGERIHFVLHLLKSDFAFENEVGRLEAYQFLLLLLHVDALVEVDSILSSDELTFHAPSPLLEVFLVPGLDLHCEQAGVDGVPVHVL